MCVLRVSCCVCRVACGDQPGGGCDVCVLRVSCCVCRVACVVLRVSCGDRPGGGCDVCVRCVLRVSCGVLRVAIGRAVGVMSACVVLQVCECQAGFYHDNGVCEQLKDAGDKCTGLGESECSV